MQSAFGLALRKFRQRGGLSQEALADICGLHRTYIGGIERGERNVSLLNIHVIAAALNITTSELMRTAEQARQEVQQQRGTATDTLRKTTPSPRKR